MGFYNFKVLPKRNKNHENLENKLLFEIKIIFFIGKILWHVIFAVMILFSKDLQDTWYATVSWATFVKSMRIYLL